MGNNNNDWFLKYYHTQNRWALKHLTGSEYKVFTYMLSIILRPKKPNADFKNGKEVYEIYRQGQLLPVNTSHEAIAESCNMDVKTVRRALNKLDEMGILLRVSKQSYGINNIYILGLLNTWHRENMTRAEYLFIDTDFLQRGEKMPDDIKKFILKYRRDKSALYTKKIGGQGKSMPEIFFPPKAEVLQFNELREGRTKLG